MHELTPVEREAIRILCEKNGIDPSDPAAYTRMLLDEDPAEKAEALREAEEKLNQPTRGERP